METNNFLIILTGLPASGKTTFAQNLKEAFEKKFIALNVKRIDPDEIRNAISDKFDYTKEPIVRKKNLDAVKKGLEEGAIVISDDLNYYSSMRHDLKEIADEFHIKFFIISIATPLDVCIEWNEQRGKPIPNDIIYEISEKFDNFGKYKWDNPLIQIDLSQIRDLNKEVSQLIDRLESGMLNEKEQKSETSNLNNENLDKITRVIIGELLKNPIYQALKKQLLNFRKDFVKLNLNKSIRESDIPKKFKLYLEQNLNLKLP